MRYDADHKHQTRQRVLRAAARALRADGPHRIGVAGVMRDAGLTHGGFYAHFASKDELVAAAIAQMFDDALAYWARCREGRDDAHALAAYFGLYLSMAHRDAPGKGCPIAALASDLPRLDAPSRAAFAAGVERLADAIAQPLARLGQGDAHALASSVLAELVGAITLARCEVEPARAEAHLHATRQQLGRRLSLDIPPLEKPA
ncbi:TetR/AcrR family transcriptional regulator [Lysobacter sp. MMG2]|uniref:TetR/AcrR family transcriptional regulator n=1 Tax=Lysobacter sp. MMG2 TaxID=2801338 RepID=UPI001C2176F7|nr:TetR/AcrR family transcriptional regulator [Lysobacter sp. MMG2]MBU8977528.1 TetR/AcrR family transcriptional regulator [Lysobacter sp. MMG2]